MARPTGPAVGIHKLNGQTQEERTYTAQEPRNSGPQHALRVLCRPRSASSPAFLNSKD
jgi:hypothetical protein